MESERQRKENGSSIRSVFVTGGTGFVGSAVMAHLRASGMDVTCLTRDPVDAAGHLPPGVRAVKWDAGRDTTLSLEGVDAVVHLAGAPAVGVRLTEARKRLVLDSRVESTKALLAAMKRASSPPQVLVSASAVGYYGARDGSEVLDESASSGSDFLSEVCQKWEAAAAPAEALGVRVVRTRLGIVFGDGGPLEVMARPFRMFVGGPIAGGDQVISWVDISDVARAIQFCLENPGVSGPVNVCSPQPATNAEVSRAIAKVLGRPNLFPVPAFGLKLLFGEGAEPIVTGQRVTPDALLAAGFLFERESLMDCVSAHLIG